MEVGDHDAKDGNGVFIYLLGPCGLRHGEPNAARPADVKVKSSRVDYSPDQSKT